ncbi:lactonase family protein [Flavobacterium jejuense]|uniref:Lactonase family protein n=1 Tax=Flavobacterium jejuense TaxID=1544455 RepID=A0ABX0INL1_9FLAO|nr:lactonase family protein [Flavobacterium jejuense]NHN24379.1 lactonase family protein [Flavobacterium jejuense]
MKYLSLFVCLFVACLSCKKTEEKVEESVIEEVQTLKERYLVGTYTDSLSQGINLVSFTPANQELKLDQVIDSLQNPSFVISNKEKTIVVTVGEIQGEKGGLLTSFFYSKKDDSFIKVSTVNTLGNDPCTLAFSPNEKAILVGNYSGGNLSVFPINEKGEILDTPQLIQHEGSSVTKERQEKAHVHCVVFHPKDSTVFVTDLGKDTVDIIPYTEENDSFKLLSENTISVKVPAGSGPRHILFSINGKTAYVVFELTNEVGVFDYKGNSLVLKEVLGLTDSKNRLGSAAELKLSKDNKFLYVSVRGEDNQIVVFKLNSKATIEKIQTIKTGLKPRNFTLSKEEDFILVANQESNTIVVYKRDKRTGLLTKTSSEIIINKPVYFYQF